MNQINSGGTNYQTDTGEGNTNHFGETHIYNYPAAPPAIEGQPFQVPYSRNPYFTGRSALLSELHESLGQTGAAALNQAKAICGLGGVGKTQTAIEYAYRYFHDQKFYEWVFWVNADELTLTADFGAIATKLLLPNHDTQVLEEKIASAQHWLETHDRWLLIFDNADCPGLLKPLRPRNPKGRLLLTSRAQEFDALAIAQPIAVQDMSRAEAREFLLRRTEKSAEEAIEATAAEQLAQQLGYLPLALEQAGAYILAKQLSFGKYLTAYRQRRLQLLEQKQPQTGDYPASVATTWSLNFEAVQRITPAAAELLNLSAFLASDQIPFELLERGRAELGEVLGEALAAVTDDPLVIPDLLSALTCYSLVRVEAAECYSIHRMGQEVLRDAMAVTTRQQWIDRGIAALNEVFPSVVLETWGQCARLVAHVQVLEPQMAVLPEPSLAAAWLLNQAGGYLGEQGRYSEAEPLYVRSLQINEQQLGAEHPDTAQSLNNLAELYDTTGRYSEAEPLLVRSLQIRKQQLGAAHPDTAQSLNNLAELYNTTGRYSEAEPLYIRAVAIFLDRLGETHPNTQAVWSNFVKFVRQAIESGQAVQLSDHRDTGEVRTNAARNPKLMPVLPMFYGIVVLMYYFDNQRHHLPHIYVKYQDDEAVISIPAGELLEGELRKAKLKLVQAWIEIHQDELMANWELAIEGQQVFKIDPLR